MFFLKSLGAFILSIIIFAIINDYLFFIPYLTTMSLSTYIILFIPEKEQFSKLEIFILKFFYSLTMIFILGFYSNSIYLSIKDYPTKLSIIGILYVGSLFSIFLITWFGVLYAFRLPKKTK